MSDLVILDTNVILSGLRSRRGFSFKLLELLTQEQFKIGISVPLILEYESVLLRFRDSTSLSERDIKGFIDYLCKVGQHVKIYYLWRPFLKDPYDDHILEVAVSSGSGNIITFNKKDFQGINQFGISVLTPKEFLIKRGVA
ncbi:MAG: putative toxin-antitoxin system toxin component, PIN family [Spirochaetaceae bacterium]|nr:putative toxin-antitoxin system toxin component, PIN family [Spirochaetaceae bacterium]